MDDTATKIKVVKPYKFNKILCVSFSVYTYRDTSCRTLQCRTTSIGIHLSADAIELTIGQIKYHIDFYKSICVCET